MALSGQDFERIYRDNYARLHYFAYDILGDIEASKDVVGEVFAALWKRRDAIDGDRARGLLFVSVRNKTFSWLKRNQRQAAVPPAMMAAIAAETEDEWAEKEHRLQEMAAVVAQLPPRTRHVLEQCYYYGKTYKQVAEELGITPDGVKKHIVKAFTVLRRHFKVKKD